MATISFSEFFLSPTGPRGLELTGKLRQLEGKTVRISGFVVEEERPQPARFLLAPLPVELHPEHYGLADDLPASTVYVSGPARLVSQRFPKTALITTTGVLHLGNREEADGRISLIRLTLTSAPHFAGAGQRHPDLKGAESLHFRFQQNQK